MRKHSHEQHKQCRDALEDVPSAPCLCTLLTSVVAAIVPSCYKCKELYRLILSTRVQSLIVVQLVHCEKENTLS